jgi:hypothetical protein
VSSELKAIYDVARYRPLGLIANPFLSSDAARAYSGTELSVVAASHELLGKLLEASDQEMAKPIAVTKSTDTRSYYHSRAIGLTERAIAADEGVGVLHAYVQLFMMRMGRIRSVLGVLAERLAFRDFDTTLQFYIEKLLTEPDDSLVAYQILGEEGLAAFAERFHADPAGIVSVLFGGEEVERHPELMELADPRVTALDVDVDEDDAAPEIDNSLGDSPANAMLLANADDGAELTEEENNDQEVVDYIVEYTKAHHSPVIARGLRVYRERGMHALVTELKVTKAPKKTLAALARFAGVRFKKVALIFDGFEEWDRIAPEVRALIAANLSEIRWSLDKDAVMTFLLDEGGVAELAEQFGGGTKLTWDHWAAARSAEDPKAINADVVDYWLASAASAGAQALTMEDATLAALAEASGDLPEFAQRAAVAIEDAAERGVPSLDAAALEAGMTPLVAPGVEPE